MQFNDSTAQPMRCDAKRMKIETEVGGDGGEFVEVVGWLSSKVEASQWDEEKRE